MTVSCLCSLLHGSNVSFPSSTWRGTWSICGGRKPGLRERTAPSCCSASCAACHCPSGDAVTVRKTRALPISAWADKGSVHPSLPLRTHWMCAMCPQDMLGLWAHSLPTALVGDLGTGLAMGLGDHRLLQDHSCWVPVCKCVINRQPQAAVLEAACCEGTSQPLEDDSINSLKGQHQPESPQKGWGCHRQHQFSWLGGFVFLFSSQELTLAQAVLYSCPPASAQEL